MSAFHLKVPPNRFGRDFVIGDLHGKTAALNAALEAQRFTPGRDRLFSVGDLIDRGEDSPGAARLIEKRWFKAVRGNHEDLLLRAIAGDEPHIIELWRQNGGSWGLDGDAVNDAARAAAALCITLPFVITLHHRNGKRLGICHAQCPVDDWDDIDRVANDKELQTEMLWARNRIHRDNPQPVKGIDWTIHGHTIVNSPLSSANALFVDTGCYKKNGRLSLLCLDDLN